MISSVVLSLAFAGCSSKQPENKTDGTSPSKPEEQQSSQTLENWEDLDVILNDQVYRIPCEISELEKNGWKIKTNKYVPETAPGGAKTGLIASMQATEEDAALLEFSFGVRNNTEEELPINECLLNAISVKKEDINIYGQGVFFELAKNITFGSSEQEILDAYGTPDEVKPLEDGEGKELKYMADNGAEMRLTVDDKKGVLVSAWLLLSR